MYLWIFIVGIFFAFYNAWGIGANDCANSFATSVGAKVLTLKQAVLVAAIFEFSGAVLMGSHVTDAIRKKIVDKNIFMDDPGALMYGMLCADLTSAIWLTIATYLKWPVSTTHSIIGSIIGFSLAYGGKDALIWDKIGFIVLSWILSPILSGIISSGSFYSINRFVFMSKEPYKNTKTLFPLISFITFFINTLFIIYKGSPQLKLDDTPLWVAILSSFLIGITTALMSRFLYVPYADKKITKLFNDSIEYTDSSNKITVVDRNDSNQPGNNNETDNETQTDNKINELSSHTDNKTEIDNKSIEIKSSDATDNSNSLDGKGNTYKDCTGKDDHKIESGNDTLNNRTLSYNDAINVDDNVLIYNNENVCDNEDYNFLYNSNESIENNISKSKKIVKNLSELRTELQIAKNHQNAHKIDPKSEKLCNWIQIITACFSSFAHGSNDVANAVAPLATIYHIYKYNSISSKSNVPIWILVLGGVGIVIGLATWGYKLINKMGRQLTKISSSRGFIIELGAALSVIIASRAEMPVSTTHCQIGSIVGCGLVGGIKNIEWKLIYGILFSWFVTLPFTGLLSAAIFSYGYYSP